MKYYLTLVFTIILLAFVFIKSNDAKFVVRNYENLSTDTIPRSINEDSLVRVLVQDPYFKKFRNLSDQKKAEILKGSFKSPFKISDREATRILDSLQSNNVENIPDSVFERIFINPEEGKELFLISFNLRKKLKLLFSDVDRETFARVIRKAREAAI